MLWYCLKSIVYCVKMHSMKWDDLKILRAVGSEGSFSGAARQLAMTHSTVSRRMRAFEDGLGVSLFEHTGEGIALTAAGEELFATAQSMGEDADTASLRLAGRDAQLRGVIQVSLVDATGKNLMSCFQRFLQAYPEIRLDIELGPNLVSLSRREADVIVRATNNPPETLLGRKLAEHSFPVYAAPGLVKRVGPDVPLTGYPWVCWENGMMDRWMARHAPAARIVCRMNTASGMVEAVRAGIGVGHLACYGVEQDPDFVRVYPPSREFDLGIWLLTHPDLKRSARIRTFMDFVGKEIAAQRDLIEGRVVDPTVRYLEL